MHYKKFNKFQISDKNFTPGVIDIGNSRLKISIGDNSFSVETTGDWKKGLIKFLKKQKADNLYLGYSAVRSDNINELEKICKSNNIILKNVFPLLSKQSKLKYDEIKGIGSDRLLGLYGALKIFDPPLFTVDCGTAVTVNAVDRKRNCLGGAIFAGVFTQLKALTQNAEKLYQVNMELPEKASGRNTEDALRSGILNSVAGAIMEIADKISDQEFGGREIPVVLCGGYSELIFEILDDKIDLLYQIENLVLKGILSLMEDCQDSLEL